MKKVISSSMVIVVALLHTQTAIAGRGKPAKRPRTEITETTQAAASEESKGPAEMEVEESTTESSPASAVGQPTTCAHQGYGYALPAAFVCGTLAAACFYYSTGTPIPPPGISGPALARWTAQTTLGQSIFKGLSAICGSGGAVASASIWNKYNCGVSTSSSVSASSSTGPAAPVAKETDSTSPIEKEETNSGSKRKAESVESSLQEDRSQDSPAEPSAKRTRLSRARKSVSRFE